MHPGQVPPCFLSGTAIRRKDAAPRRFAPYRSVSLVYLQCIFSVSSVKNLRVYFISKLYFYSRLS